MVYLVESYGPGAAASGMLCFLFGILWAGGFVFPFVLNLWILTHCATAIAANGSFRYLLGAVFPLFTIQMYEKLGVHWAGSVFAFLSLLLLPIPFILFKFGHRLRKNSRFISAAMVVE